MLSVRFFNSANSMGNKAYKNSLLRADLQKGISYTSKLELGKKEDLLPYTN